MDILWAFLFAILVIDLIDGILIFQDYIKHVWKNKYKDKEWLYVGMVVNDSNDGSCWNSRYSRDTHIEKER
jgi:hypothetical protein